MSYTYGTYDCFSDIGATCYVWCCPCFAIGNIGEKIGDGNASCCNVILSALASHPYVCLCSLCCCPRMISFCFYSDILDKSMAFHQITQHPDPCPGAKCCSGATEFYQSTCCCNCCLTIVMYREAFKQ